MGIYIKDMEMPTKCLDCPFMISRDNDDCILQSEEANHKANTWDELKKGCPLIDLTLPEKDLQFYQDVEKVFRMEV